jgi:hypothetical protein
MPKKKRTKTISPVDNGTKQHSITEYGRKEPTKIVLREKKEPIKMVLREIKPES